MKVRTFSLGAGADTVVFSSKSSADANTITNFGADDVLQFKTTSGQLFDGLATTLDASGALTSVGSSAVSVASSATTVYKGTLANLAKLQGTSSFNNKVVVAVATDEGNEGIYAVTLKSTADATSIVKVGTLTGVDLDTLTMANFAAA